jgi:hypothetical protein
VNHVRARRERRDLGKKDVVQFAQPIEIVIDDRDVRTHAHGDLRCGSGLLRPEVLCAIGLNMALGEGVSSSLFPRLHEREALVYSVGSFAEQYLD